MCNVDDVIGGGDETFDRIMTVVRKEFDFGAWDVGKFRFKGRHISHMPNGEIVFDMEQYKRELEQIEVSKADKTKPERLVHSYHVSRQNCIENNPHRHFKIC